LQHLRNNQQQPTNQPTEVMDALACGIDLVFSARDDVRLNVLAEWEDIFTNNDMFALKEDELQIHYRKRLGDGAFCNVYPAHIRNNRTGKFNELLPPFAIKQLKLDVTENPQLLNHAYADLAHEANLMRQMQHENIITMYGMSDESVGQKNFFVVVEKLEGTLESKLVKWTKIRGPFKQFSPQDVVELRVEHVAIPIASGLAYLHSNNIIYRDIKPGNIGFDEQGQVKIFDFGLAVKVTKNAVIKGPAGTIRYMAPEMKIRGKKKAQPYSYPVDIFSFSILCWEIITSRIPFEKDIPTSSFSTPKELPEDKRPNLKYVESKELAALLEKCWCIKPDERWDFGKIIPELKNIVLDLSRGGEGKGKKKPSSAKRQFISSMNNY
jgi:serine/threonine protein kinase